MPRSTKKITFVDSGVLIAALRGNEHDSIAAFKILADAQREFASSIFIRMEVSPKAVFYNNSREMEFYEAFFSSVEHWCVFTDELLGEALEEAKRCGMGALDALHVVSAAHSGADELATAERRGKPIYRTTLCKVISISEFI
jgi:predicted nucleic acid-binding protein